MAGKFLTDMRAQDSDDYLDRMERKRQERIANGTLRKLPVQPLMATLLLGGETADVYLPKQPPVLDGVQWVVPPMPTRRRVSIEEFERDMREAGVRK